MAARIEIVEPDPGWPSEFAELAATIRAALGDLALRIDHIGSTSVPDLPAKDVVDIQVTVASLDVEPLTSCLASIGYTRRVDIGQDHVPPGDLGNVERWQKLYFRTPEGQRPTHLHVRKLDNPNQRYPLLFRDYLRVSRDAADAYAQIKIALARLHPTDVEAYYDVKDPVCDLIIQAAELWAASTGWQPGRSDA